MQSPYLVTITLTQIEFDALTTNLRALENFAIDIEEPLLAESLYQSRLSLIHNSDRHGAISCDNPTLN